MSTVQGGQGNIVTNGLILNLDAANPRSYEPPFNGTTWQNLVAVSSSISGSLVNGVGYTGSNNGALVFDGINDYVDCGTSFNNLTTQLSINLWGKINGSPTDGIIVTKGENDGTITSNFGFQISPSSCLRFYAKASGASYTTIDSNTNIRDNNINNYVLTYNAGTVIFYKNGNLYSSHTFGLSSLPTTTGPLYIAALKGYATGYFPGNMYSTQIYNRALNASEVLQNFNTTRARFGV